MLRPSSSASICGAVVRPMVPGGRPHHVPSIQLPQAVRQVAQVATLNDTSELSDLVTGHDTEAEELRETSLEELESRRVSYRDASSSCNGATEGKRRRTRVPGAVKESSVPFPSAPASIPTGSVAYSFTMVTPHSPNRVLGDEQGAQATVKTNPSQESGTPGISSSGHANGAACAEKPAVAFEATDAPASPAPSAMEPQSIGLLEALSSLEDTAVGQPTTAAGAGVDADASAAQASTSQPGPLSRKRRGHPFNLSSQINNAPNLKSLCELYGQRHKEIGGKYTVAMMRRFAALVLAAGCPSLNQLPYKSQELWHNLCERTSALSPSFSVREVADVLHAVVVVFQRDDLGLSKAGDAAQAGGQQQPGSKAPPSGDTPICVSGQRSSGAVPCVLPNSSGGESGLGKSAAMLWDGDMTAGDSESAPMLRPLATRRRVPHAMEDLIFVLTHHVQARLTDPDLRPVDFSRLVVSLGRLGVSYRPNAEWYATFFAASQPCLATCELVDLLTLSYGLGRLCPKAIPSDWSLEFYRLTQRQLKNLSMREMCMLLHAVAHLPVRPPPLWLQEALHRSTEMFDHFDAPAYSMTLHALGLLSFRPPRAWVEEFMDSCATLLNDFSPEELSLLLRGCALMKLKPRAEWLDEMYFQSASKLPNAGGPQLADIAWALTNLSLQPPKYWVHEYVRALGKRVNSIGTKVHAQRTAQALQHFRVKKLQQWCVKLKVEELPDKAPWEEEHLNREANSSIMSVSSLSSIDDYGTSL